MKLIWLFGFALMSVRCCWGSLLVTEFLADPSGTDIDREWFEIYNSGDAPINLTGYAAGDGTNPTNASTGEGMGLFPDGTIINPGQVFVIAANANGFAAFYGFLPNFEFFNSTSTLGNNAAVPDMMQKPDWGASAGSLGIANGGDDIGILTPDSTALAFTFVDGSNHGTVQTFFGGAPTLLGNQSYERVPADQDTNSAADWIVRTSNTATPGLVTIPEPGSVSLVTFLGGVLALRRRRQGRDDRAAEDVPLSCRVFR
jgi:hypothetical protein